MSEDLFSHGGLTVSKYVGPELPISDAGIPYAVQRQRYQLTRDDGVLITLNHWQWSALAQYFRADCSTECESVDLDKPMPENWRWED